MNESIHIAKTVSDDAQAIAHSIDARIGSVIPGIKMTSMAMSGFIFKDKVTGASYSIDAKIAPQEVYTFEKINTTSPTSVPIKDSDLIAALDEYFYAVLFDVAH